jgi:hypothetical protein
LRPWTALESGWHLRLDWLCDSLREALAGRKRRLTEFCGTHRVVLGSSLTAAVLGLLVGLQPLHRQAAERTATLPNDTPPPTEQVHPPVQLETKAVTSDLKDKRRISPRELAQAEPIPTPEAPAAGGDGPPRHKTTVPTRYGFDLEQGTLMPPDSRDSRQVY